MVAAQSCSLCGLPAPYPLHDDAGRGFCCPACREVSGLLAAEVHGANPASAGNAVDCANPEALSLNLGGLWCLSCGWLIDEKLRRAPGVLQAEVNFLQRQAQISYDPGRTAPQALARAVRRLGYRAWLPGERPYDEEEALANRLLIAFVLTMHVMMISWIQYGREFLGLASPETEWLQHIFTLMSLVAATPVVLILGLPILRAGMASLIRGRPNIHTLIAIGTFSAFALSIRNLALDSGRVYFDTAAVLLLLVGVGRWLEIRAQKNSTAAVERLFEQMPAQATWITPEGDQTVAADAVRPGARIRVRPGERFAVDGIVAAGHGDVDESLLTGEPEPVFRRSGDHVLAGAINLDGLFEVITTAVGPGTRAGQIGQLLHQALWQRAPIERLADRIAALMVPAALALALITFGFWSWRAGAETGLINALSVLLIACPCALGVATPLTLWLGLGRAAQEGILLRSAGALEKLATVGHVFFDKTGTLTRRPIRLQEVRLLPEAELLNRLDESPEVQLLPEVELPDCLSEAEFLALVRAVEAGSEHPLAQAIVAGIDSRHPTLSAFASLSAFVVNFRALPGAGVVARAGAGTVAVGSRRLMDEQGLALAPALGQQAAAWQRRGLTVVYAGWDGRVMGLLGLGETIRKEAAAALADLRKDGIQVTVLTGDDAAAGQRWQRLLGVPVLAEQRPEDKLRHLESTKTLTPSQPQPQPQRRGVAMVGDGINDGPALAAATVGIAVAQGTDVAQSAAEVILLREDLGNVPWLLALSRAAMRKVRQNLVWAFAYNGFGITLAMAGLLQPAFAALLMVANSLFVTANAMRLQKFEGAGRQPRSEAEPLETTNLQPESQSYDRTPTLLRP